MNLFDYKDFLQFDAPPETLARYCNDLILQRTKPVRLDPHYHDVIRADVGFTKEHLEGYPKKGLLIILYGDEK